MSAVAGVLTVAGLGVVFAGLSGSRLLKARRLRGRGVAAQGTVVGQYGSPSAGGASSVLLQHPEIVFTTADGRMMRVTSPAGSSESQLLPGQTVTVYYDPADPAKVSIPAHETVIHRILFALGVALLVGVLAWAVSGGRILDVLPFGIPFVLGVVFAGIGFTAVRRTSRIKHGGKADGVVVGSVASEDRDGLTRHHPVVRYTDGSGRTHEVPSTASGMRRPPPPGTPVRVCYDPTDPQRMMLGYEGTSAVLVLFAVIGVFLMAVGVVIPVAVALH